MSQSIRSFARRSAASLAVITLGLVAVPASAEVVITPVNQNLSASTYSFTFMGGTFTFDTRGSFPNFLNVQTSGGAAVRTVFGNPSTDFTNRGTVTYDANTLGGYGSFPNRTNVSFTNGDNFLGLRVTSNGQNYYGFAYTTNQVFNSFGFETRPNVGITATTVVPAAVPEPGTWAMLILGFGVVGFSMRQRKAKTTLAYA